MEVRKGYKKTEVGVIPQDWDVAALRGKVSIYHGFPFASEHFTTHGFYKLTTPGHFHESGGFRDIGEKQKFYDGPVPSDYLLQPGDLIVAMTEQADGLLGSAAIIPKTDGYLHNQRLGHVRPISQVIDLRYLFWVFNSSAYRIKVRETAAGTKVKHTSPEKLLEINTAIPPLPEQRAIAEALGDVDGLIEALDRLIAKKRDLKQAAMQQLLTAQTRLPGFSGKWEVKRLGDVLKVRHGKSQHGVTTASGSYPILASGGEIGRTNHFLYDKPSVLIGRKGTIDSPQLVETPFWTVDTLFFTEINSDNHVKFIFYVFCTINWRNYNEASGVPSLNAKTIETIETKFPDLAEQTAIAMVLSDMDAEITALESRRDKTRALKQGMMQELLTGKTRLV